MWITIAMLHRTGRRLCGPGARATHTSLKYDVGNGSAASISIALSNGPLLTNGGVRHDGEVCHPQSNGQKIQIRGIFVAVFEVH